MSDTDRALREANPIPDSQQCWAPGTLDARALSELAQLHATREPSRRRLLIGAAAAITLAAGTGAVSLALPSATPAAQAATPALLPLAPAPTTSATAQLLALAARARTSTAAPVTVSREVTYAGWYLNTSVSSSAATSSVCPEQIEQRDNGDGTLTRRTVDLGGCNPDTGVLDTAAPAGADVDEQSIPASQTPAPPNDATQLPAYLDRLGDVTRAGSAGLFQAVRDLAITYSLDPALRADLLTVLATAPGITAAGQTTDRFQRTGRAFTTDSDASGLPTRYVLVLDPDTGNLLGYEEWLTKDAGRLNVAIPAVTEYEAWRY